MPKGRHGLEFEVVEGWERLPEGWSFTEVAGVPEVHALGVVPNPVSTVIGRCGDDRVFESPGDVHFFHHGRDRRHRDDFRSRPWTISPGWPRRSESAASAGSRPTSSSSARTARACTCRALPAPPAGRS